jgi:type IV secretion system protein VirB10
MKTLLLFLLSAMAVAQTVTPVKASTEDAKSSLTIPAGTRVPLSLKQAISTKTAKEGDPVYAETSFPFVVNDRIVIPSGTYIQGKITHVQRGGHVKGRAQLLVHFTSMIYPSGYTVMLGGSVENTPGADKTSMKDSEGTIQHDSDAGRKARDAATGATTGAVIGAVSGGAKGAGIGAGAGGLVGVAISMLSRGADVRLEPGTSIEMEIQREVTVDANRISARPSMRVEQ